MAGGDAHGSETRGPASLNVARRIANDEDFLGLDWTAALLGCRFSRFFHEGGPVFGVRTKTAKHKV